MEKEKKINAVQQTELDSMINKIEININPTLEREQSENQKISSNANQISLLIAEDDELYFEFIETILFSFDFKIFHAKDGQEAVNIYQANNDIKLILMDIQMPIMDGFSATTEIRKINSEVPIIAQTSFYIKRIKEKAFASGCNDFLPKPIEPEVLIMKIEEYLTPTDQNLMSLQ